MGHSLNKRLRQQSRRDKAYPTDNQKMFKNKLNEHLLIKYYYTISEYLS